MKRTKLTDRTLPVYTRGEEIFNMVTHVAGGALAVAALTLCVTFAALHRDPWALAAGIVYGVTVILLYTMSGIYHGLSPHTTAKKVFQIFDHCAIFLLIAGTYTPFTLCTLRPVNPLLGWTIFGVVWGVSVLGIVLNAIDLKKYSVFSMVCYVGLGWCIVAAFRPLQASMPAGGIALLVSGGVAYTLGVVFFLLQHKIKYMHSIFHLFVLAGSILHFFAILLYVM